jgi:hypothetical protein
MGLSIWKRYCNFALQNNSKMDKLIGISLWKIL